MFKVGIGPQEEAKHISDMRHVNQYLLIFLDFLKL